MNEESAYGLLVTAIAEGAGDGMRLEAGRGFCGFCCCLF